MSLKLIERQVLARQAREAEKAKPTGVSFDLAAALQEAINTALASQEALQRAQPPRLVQVPSPEILRRLEALEHRLQAPATFPEISRIKIERDSAGLAQAVTIVGTGQRLLVKRNAKGTIAAMVPADSNSPINRRS